MKLNPEERSEFNRISEDILTHHNYRKLKTYIQHGSVSTYQHSINVAKFSLYLNHRLHIRADDTKVIRTGLLHDYYLYDWHTEGDHLHGFHHPAKARDNALRDFQITGSEADAILTHMWPLNLHRIPNTRVAWLLTVSDKVVSLHETIRNR